MAVRALSWQAAQVGDVTPESSLGKRIPRLLFIMNYSFDAMLCIKSKQDHDICQVSTFTSFKYIYNLKIQTEIQKTYIGVLVLYFIFKLFKITFYFI